jgi:hypothetical protein
MPEKDSHKNDGIDYSQCNDLRIFDHLQLKKGPRILDKNIDILKAETQTSAHQYCGDYSENEKQDINPDGLL